MEDGSGGGVSAPVFMGVRLFVGTTEGGMGPRMREDTEREGWVACARTRRGGMGPRIARTSGGGGMGPRMREDTQMAV